ncbi:MAG: hypothetical protein ACYC5Y_10915 [Symbiobacteriia bacterium]
MASADNGPFFWLPPSPVPIAVPARCLTPPSEIPPTIPAQLISQEKSSAQGMESYSSVGEFQQVGTAGENWLTGGTLNSIAAAHNLAHTLGSVGPTYGPTPFNMAWNAQYSQLANATASQLNQTNATLALIRTGATALLAQSGRTFLGNTYSSYS